MVKLGFSLQSSYALPMPRVMALLKEVGFCAVSTAWKREGNLGQIVRLARENSLAVQSLHGPTHDTFDLWSRDESRFRPVLEDMLDGIERCAEYEIPVMVVHSWLGKEYTFREEDLFFDNFNKIVEQAGRKGVGIAFENLEGPEYLAAMMDYYKGCQTVGLCWDSGHELCYNPGWDFLRDYGDRLMMTHLNDNFGLTSPDGKLVTTDDLHLLAGDGKTDWPGMVEKLKKCKQQEILNFELKIRPKGDRCIYDIYSQLPLEEYLRKAYQTAAQAVGAYFE